MKRKKEKSSNILSMESPTLLDFVSWSGIFCERLPGIIIFTWPLHPDPMQFTTLAIFRIPKAILAVKLDIQGNGDVTNGCI